MLQADDSLCYILRKNKILSQFVLHNFIKVKYLFFQNKKEINARYICQMINKLMIINFTGFYYY